MTTPTEEGTSSLPVPGTDVTRTTLWPSVRPEILGVGTATILARQDTIMMVLQDIRDRSDRIEKMLRKHGLDLDEHDEEGPTAKRRRLSSNLNQSILDNLVAATVTWVEGHGNRIFKTKGKGPNAMAMAKRWRDGMTLDKGITNCSGWTDEQLLYNFVTVSKEVARQERVGGNQEPADIDDNDDSEE